MYGRDEYVCMVEMVVNMCALFLWCIVYHNVYKIVSVCVCFSGFVC